MFWLLSFIVGLIRNSAFPARTVYLKAVQAAADDLNAALLAAQAYGWTAATAEKSNKQKALLTVLLKRLFMEIEEESGASEAKRCSGYEENSSGTAFSSSL